MKDISKVLSAAMVLVGMRFVYSVPASMSSVCAGNSMGFSQSVQSQPSYMLMQPTPEPVANCSYSQASAPYYVPANTPASAQVVRSEPQQVQFVQEPQQVQFVQEPQQVQVVQEEAAPSCTVTMVKHCENSEPTPPVPHNVQQVQSMPVSFAAAEQVRVASSAPVYEQVGTPVHANASFAAQSVSTTPCAQQSSAQQSSAPMILSDTVLSQQSTSACPYSSQSSAGTCPNPLPATQNQASVGGNGYPANAVYTPNLGQISSCAMQKVAPTPPQCEKPEKQMQYSAAEACTSPTPTIVIGNNEYFAAPQLYSSLTSPCTSCSCQA